MDKTEVYEILEEQYFGDNAHEQSELRMLGGLIDQGVKQVIDVGASLGQYTRAFASMSKDVIIIAVESDPIRAERLRHNCLAWANEWETEITVIEAAASDVGGECSFYTTESNVSGSFNKHDETVETWKKITVPAVTLDDIAIRFDNTFVKMDIEGGEYAALMGAQELLNGEGNGFLVELHVWGDRSRGKTVRDVLEIFSKHGYSMSKFFRHYYFRKTGSASRLRYMQVRMFFWLKEKVYFSRLRALAERANGVLKQLRR